ncbi:hypothetical protein D3C77_430350 [compost metagenome]
MPASPGQLPGGEVQACVADHGVFILRAFTNHHHTASSLYERRVPAFSRAFVTLSVAQGAAAFGQSLGHARQPPGQVKLDRPTLFRGYDAPRSEVAEPLFVSAIQSRHNAIGLRDYCAGLPLRLRKMPGGRIQSYPHTSRGRWSAMKPLRISAGFHVRFSLRDRSVFGQRLSHVEARRQDHADPAGHLF